MLAMGFETQAELAQHIAQHEGLTKPPRDLVSKVFREQAVSPHNLARIAHALQVEAHTIYLSKDNNPFTEVISGQHTEVETAPVHQAELQHNTQVPRPRSQSLLTNRSLHHLWFALTALIILLGSLLWWQQSNAGHVANQPLSTELTSPLGKVFIVLQAPSNLHPFAEHIARQLSEQDTIQATVLSAPESYQLSSTDALATWQAHGVLRLVYHESQHYDAIEASMVSSQHNLSIYQSVFHRSAFVARSAAIRDAIVTQSQRFIHGEPLAPALSQSSAALQHYLLGKDQLFTSHAASSFLLAESFFLDALDIETNFAAAWAELCRIYVRISWIQDETPSLEKAASFCQLASEQQPNRLSVLTARAELLARTGRTTQALDLLNETVPLTNNDADALAVKAIIHLARFGQEDPEPQAELAEAFASRAIELVPGHWQANNSLGNLYFMQGNTQQAKAHFALASQTIQHEIILANLGALQMCHGELEQATQSFQALITHFDNDYMGLENLGTVYHFQQDYEAALKYKLLAIEKQPDMAIHQVWSSLAELYLRLEHYEQAKEQYNHAITLIERDELLGNVSKSDQLHKLYYQTKLLQLAPDHSLSSNLQQQIDTFYNARDELGLKAKSHLAWLLGTAGQQGKKQQLWQDISAICPVYAQSPELLVQEQQRSGSGDLQHSEHKRLFF